MSEAKLNRKLNLVQTIETEKGNVYVHTVPISISVFRDNYLPISMAFTEMYVRRLGPIGGPRIAKYLLLDKAKELDVEAHTQQSLLTEIQRLTHVIALGNGGWETIPYREAINRGLLGEEETEKVENTIVYFTCASSIGVRAELELTLDGLRTLWGVQTTLLNVTDHMRSLPISTQAASTGENVTPLPEKSRLSIPG
jgi:hypothetical protein